MILAATHGCRRFTEMYRIVLSIGAIFLAIDATASDVAVDTILKDLHRPRGIAVRPGGTADRFEVFVADSWRGRVVRWSNQSPKQAVEMVTDFEANVATALSEQTGPLALWFLDPGLLVVGTTQSKSGDLLRAYELQDGEKAFAADTVSEATSKSSGLVGATCTAIARSRVNEFVADRLFLAVRRVDGRAQLMASRVQAGMIGEPQPFGTHTSSAPAGPRDQQLGPPCRGRRGRAADFLQPYRWSGRTGDVDEAEAADRPGIQSGKRQSVRGRFRRRCLSH